MKIAERFVSKESEVMTNKLTIGENVHHNNSDKKQEQVYQCQNPKCMKENPESKIRRRPFSKVMYCECQCEILKLIT